MAFSVPKKYRKEPEELIRGEQYEKIRENIVACIKKAREIPYEDVYITTKDALTLHARYYEVEKGAPVQILCHGYRSNPLLDFSGGLQLSIECGCNTLVIDQRAHGKSGGRYLAFGVKERYDLLEWVKYICRRQGDAPIVLVGISMGAATVCMASDLELPENVKGIIADSGYDSPRSIIRNVIKHLKYPVGAAYFFLRTGGRMFGGFDIEESDSLRSLSRTNIPVLFIHGGDDRFVPKEMSIEAYNACNSQKELVIIEGAGHALCYMIDPEAYRRAYLGFLEKTIGENKE